MARDRLTEYRGKRSFEETPEPAGRPAASDGAARFVIQEHHARRLHWDLRLERDGVLVSWALPRGMPWHPDENRLAVHTEDHPLEYIDFHGEIPAGQYGAGTMEIWDSGTYQAEKFEESKVIVTLAGEKVSGRYALFHTRGDDWMIHRMDPPPAGWEPMPERLEPMLPTPGRLPADEESWAFEIRWEGVRALAYCEPGHLRLVSAEAADATGKYGEVRGLLEQLRGVPALLDGVIVAFGEDGRPDSKRIQRRRSAQSESQVRRLRRSAPVTYVAFDLLHLGGTPLLELPYERRRSALEELGLEGEAWQTPAFHRGEGEPFLAAAAERGLSGVVAKRLASPYKPGGPRRDWRSITT